MLCSAASAVRSPMGTPTRRPQSARARSRCSSKSTSTSTSRPQARVASVRARARTARGSVLRHPVAATAGARRHGNERQDDDDVPARGDRPRRRRARRRDRHARHGRRRRDRPAGAHHAGSDRAAGVARARCATPASATVAMEVSSHALDQHRVDGTQLRGGVLHEPLARPPRLPRHDRRVLRGQGRDCSTRGFSRHVAVSIDDPYGRVLATARLATGLDVWTYAVDDPTADVPRATCELHAPTARASTLVAARDDRDARSSRRPLLGDFNVANLLAAAATARAGLDLRSRRRRPRRADPRARADRAGRRRPATSRSRRLRPHARRARARAALRAAAARLDGAAASSCSAAAAIATVPSGR